MSHTYTVSLALCSGGLRVGDRHTGGAEDDRERPAWQRATRHVGGSTQEAVLAMGRAAIAGLAEAVPVAELRG